MKGVVYILEVSVAILMILSLLLIMPKIPRKKGYSTSIYQLQVFDALESLDEIGLLRKASLDRDVDTLSERLGDLISSKINYQVVLFNSTTNVTNFEEMNADEIYSVSYFIVGDYGKYEPMEIRVYLWR